MTTTTQRRCVAPLAGPPGAEKLCGLPATEQVVLEDVVCDLCREHADQIRAEEEKK